ncbi:MAG: hypothetical protein GY731_08130 [Gammaproteobacteria bacterium]|nr:hypothetical protein [Gammaproteobacteria bacterium]
MDTGDKLLGGLSFVSRTFEGSFKDNPYVLDMDANLYIGPADSVPRDEHASIEVIFHFLAQRRLIKHPIRELLRDRQLLLDAFIEFDDSREENAEEQEFRIFIFSTYDGVPLVPVDDDLLPAGPCGMSINDVKWRFYSICRRMDKQFYKRNLTPRQQQAEAAFIVD